MSGPPNPPTSAAVSARAGVVVAGLAGSDVPRRAQAALAALQGAIGKKVIGLEDTVRHLLIGLLCEGHVLLEGVPGLAKTFLVRSFAEHLDLSFRRIQFTPDMLPSDILGNVTLDPATHELTYRPGPVFGNVILADEINRAPPKVQSALLEAMQERQVTIDGVSHPLPHPFIVIATQNPVEQEGTYPLPEAELDRFMFRLLLPYPTEATELAILRNQASPSANEPLPAVLRPEELDAVSRGASQVYVDDDVLRYLSLLVRQTRADERVLLGASPRSAVLWLGASRAAALLNGRSYVTPDDIKALAFPSLNHRLILRPDILAQQLGGGASGTGDPTQRVIAGLLDSILQQLPAPR